MYNNVFFQKNLKQIESVSNYIIIPPEEGFLACRTFGIGRLANENTIVENVLQVYDLQKSNNKTILITAGATKEYLDPIRYITNNSSGKTGWYFAKHAKLMGYNVILVTTANLPNIHNIKTVNVTTAQEMYEEVFKHFAQTDIFIATAAVGDYQFTNPSNTKIKKQDDQISVTLQKNPDILYEAGKLKKQGQILIGFALETDNLEQNAILKIKNKNLDLIIANGPKNFSAKCGSYIIIDNLLNKQYIESTPKSSLAKIILQKISQM